MPMRSLFFKIFFYFMLIILLVSTAAVVLTYLRHQQFPLLAHRDFARTAIVKYGGDAIRSFERGGYEELEAFVRKLRDKSGIVMVLFDDQARPLNGRMMMRHHLQQMALRALQSGEVVFPLRGNRNGLAATVRSDAGQVYVVTLVLPERAQPQQAFRTLTHGIFGAQLLILLAVSAAVCYLLARSLSSPISRLRQATRRFAAGDLSTRIAGQVKGSSELIGLAEDFDDMAGKIEALVLAQKRLLRDISHELRSPLTRLGIALELARNPADEAVREKMLGRIGLETERMNEMIGQLLRLTRLETGGSDVERLEFDLFRLLRDVVQDADFEARSRDCRVTLQAPEPLFFRGSRELLKQALENVIRNAVRYTADATRVEVSLQCARGQLEITIADRGPGVPEDALGKLFDPFYRVADARDRESGGTGIGLAIAEHAVKWHDGRIKALNRPDGGLIVEIVLPLQH